MASGKAAQNFKPLTTMEPSSSAHIRNLGKKHLGGVIFGCKNTTYNECVFKQLFGLPASHISYVRNIEPGLPLFLFNYSGRKLHGIFEAASSGGLNINPYAWTDGSEKTPYPAQVQVKVRLQCLPLSEEQFKPVIFDNYHHPNHFWFELDHAQTSKLLALLSSRPVAPGAVSSQNTQNWRSIPRSMPSQDRIEVTVKGYHAHPRTPDQLRAYSSPPRSSGLGDFHHPHMSGQLDAYPYLPDDLDFSLVFEASSSHSRENCPSKRILPEENFVHNKLEQLALNQECSVLPSVVAKDGIGVSDHSRQLKTQKGSEERNKEDPVESSDYASVIAQLVQEVVDLKAFKDANIHKLGCMDRKLVEAEAEIRKLKHQCATLESLSNLSTSADAVTLDSSEGLELKADDRESLFLVGGYDGENWLSTLNYYSPKNDVYRSLKPMSCVRSYASVVKLNGEIYAFAGGNGFSWYNTVESYNPANDRWTLRPSLSTAKGSLAGVTVNNNIYAIGGGNGVECLADVDMLDLEAGRWISTQSMLEKRFALGAVELNGAIYAAGGYDGTGYLSSAEMFDPREHSWRKIKNMNGSRGCHSMVVLNEKIYAIGGHNGDLMGSNVEIYDPRLGSWMEGEPMNHPRGYSAAVVLGETIYVIGGTEQAILDTVEVYEGGQGWKIADHNPIGKIAFCSAIAL